MSLYFDAETHTYTILDDENPARTQVLHDPTPKQLDDALVAFFNLNPVADAKAQKITKIQEAYLSRVSYKGPLAVCPTSFGILQCDETSRGFISGLVQMALLSQTLGFPFSRKFKRADDTKTDPLTSAQMIQLGLEVGSAIGSRFDHKESLLEAVAAATTVAQVNSIDESLGW